MRVFEYDLITIPRQEVLLPVGFEFLSVQQQRMGIVMWALVDPDAPLAIVDFAIFGTGHEVPEEIATEWAYLGTVQQGPLVWHIWADFYSDAFAQ